MNQTFKFNLLIGQIIHWKKKDLNAKRNNHKENKKKYKRKEKESFNTISILFAQIVIVMTSIQLRNSL